MAKAPVNVIDDDDTDGDNVSPAARSLAAYIKRVESVTDDLLKPARADLKAVYDEAKGAGYDVKVLREIVKRRAKGKTAIEEFDALLATYETALDSVMD